MAHKDDIALMAHLMRRAGFGGNLATSWNLTSRKVTKRP